MMPFNLRDKFKFFLRLNIIGQLCIVCVTFLTLFCDVVSSGSVFMYLPVAARSHKNVWLPLAKSLAEKGHSVTMVTTFPEIETFPNYEEIVISHQQDWSQKISHVVTHPKSSAIQRILDSLNLIYMLISEVAEVHEKVLDHPRIQFYLQNSTKFDVTFVSPLFNEMGLYLSERFRSSTILYMAPVSSSLLSAAMGYFDHPVLAAQSLNLEGQQVLPRFMDRMSIFLSSIFHEQLKAVSTWSQTDLWRKKFPESDPPKLIDLERNASFGMYFSHYIFDAVRPTLPNTIDVGTIHCRSPKELPHEIRDIIQSSNRAKEHGIIFVSFGSWLQPEEMPREVIEAIISTFNKLPQLIFVKWNSSQFKFGPDIITRTWLPQQDLLGHASTRLFITQGGMMSVQESLYHGVPMLVIPLFGDQLSNGARIERQGCGKVLHMEDLTEERLHDTIIELLDNSTYQEKAKSIGALIRDDIMTPQEKAVYWTEYVMRYPGVMHLQCPIKHLSLIHFYNIDLIFVSMTGLLVFFGLLTVILWKMTRMIVLKLQ